jgi:hypothetical protein
MEPNMAKREPDGTITLQEANRKYMEDNRETERQMGSAQRAAHKAVDIAFGRQGARGNLREQKPLRAIPVNNPFPDPTQ